MINAPAIVRSTVPIKDGQSRFVVLSLRTHLNFDVCSDNRRPQRHVRTRFRHVLLGSNTPEEQYQISSTPAGGSRLLNNRRGR